MPRKPRKIRLNDFNFDYMKNEIKQNKNDMITCLFTKNKISKLSNIITCFLNARNNSNTLESQEHMQIHFKKKEIIFIYNTMVMEMKLIMKTKKFCKFYSINFDLLKAKYDENIEDRLEIVVDVLALHHHLFNLVETKFNQYFLLRFNPLNINTLIVKHYIYKYKDIVVSTYNIPLIDKIKELNVFNIEILTNENCSHISMPSQFLDDMLTFLVKNTDGIFNLKIKEDKLLASMSDSVYDTNRKYDLNNFDEYFNDDSDSENEADEGNEEGESSEENYKSQYKYNYNLIEECDMDFTIKWFKAIYYSLNYFPYLNLKIFQEKIMCYIYYKTKSIYFHFIIAGREKN